MINDITKLNAFEIGNLLDKKKIEPITLVTAFYEKYKKADTNSRNAICRDLIDEALLEAERSWKRQKSNNRLSFFDGIPSGWKDVIDIKKYPAFAGSKLLKKKRENIKVYDAKVIINAKRKGIIPLFKTSTVEFAFGGLGINNSTKYPKNQMMAGNFCPGGSSSGSAAAVYSNFIPLAVGTDTAGSIRIPSCWHSLVGFKPSYNNIPNEGILPLSKIYDTVGTICKSVKDTYLFYNILADTKLNLSKSEKKCRIGIIDNFIINDLKKKDKIIFESLLNHLSKEGFNLKKIKIPEFKNANNIIKEEGSIVNYQAWEFWKEIIKKDIKLIDKNVSSRFYLGKKMSKSSFSKVLKEVNKLKKKIYDYFNTVDFLLLPTLSIKPPKISEVSEKNSYIYYNDLVLSNTRIANLFNLPAITIPIKKDYWLSLTILAKQKKDANLLCISQDIENVLNCKNY